MDHPPAGWELETKGYLPIHGLAMDQIHADGVLIRRFRCQEYPLHKN